VSAPAQRVPLLAVAMLLTGGVLVARLVADVLYSPVAEAEQIIDQAQTDAP
jgi:hypothetical protein